MDRLRLVTLTAAGRPRTLLDLNSLDPTHGGIYRERNAFKVTAPPQRGRSVSSPRRYGGQHVRALTLDNALISDRLVVKGGTLGGAGARVEALLGQVERLRRLDEAYIEWRPEGFARSVFFPIRGPGTWNPVTDQRRLTARDSQVIEVAWPVAPLADGQPMTMRERWEPGADKPGGTINEVTNPSAELSATDGGWTSVGGTLSRDTAASDRGDYAFMVTSTAPGNMSLRHSSTGRLPAAAGEIWAARVRARSSSGGGRDMRVYLDFYNGAGTRLSVTSGAVVNGPEGVYVDVTRDGLVAPAGTVSVSVIAEMVTTAASGEILRVDKILAAKVAKAGDPPPAYGDGDLPGWRWEGDAHKSRSVELADSRLGEYSGAGVSSITIIDDLTTKSGPRPFAAPIIHDRGYPVADAEIETVAELQVLAGGTNSNYFLAAGLRYQASDGRYLWGTVEGTVLRLYLFNGTTNEILNTVSHGQTFTAGGSWSLRVRAIDNVLAAELHTGAPPIPGEEPAATVTHTFAAGHAMGAGRVGLAVPVAWPVVSGAMFNLTEWSWRPYARRNLRTPAIFHAPAVPGNAPARLALEIDTDTTAAVPFGLVAARAGGPNPAAGAGVPYGRAPFGAHPVNEVTANTTFVLNVDAAELGGYRADLDAASLSGRLEWKIDPLLMVDEDAGDTIEVEVYALGKLPATATGPRLTISAGANNLPGGRLHTREHGAGGRALTLPATGTRRRTWRLGTIPIPRRAATSGAIILRLDAAFGAGATGTFVIYYVVLVVRAASSPTGKVNDSTYPAFHGSVSSASLQVIRRVNEDLSGLVRRPADVATEDPNVHPVGVAPGLGGSHALELEAGGGEILVWTQTGAVPDDPTVNDTEAADLTSVDVIPDLTPRYRLWRP